MEGLGVRGRGPRRRRRGHSTASPTRAGVLNEVWSWDFVHDRTDNGVPLKMLTLIDEYSRQCLRIEVGRKLKSKDVLDALAGAMAERGVPHHIRSDNGPEFIARDVQNWLREMGIATIYIEPGSPWQNGHVESFHNRVHPHNRLSFQSPDGGATSMTQLEPVPGT